MPQVMHLGAPSGAPIHVFIAIPAYGHIPSAFTYSLVASDRALRDAGIAADIQILAGHCHVDDARNQLVRDFLESDCTDFVFLDADLAWQPSSLVKLVQYDRDVVAGIYPLKQDEPGFPCRHLPGEIWADDDGLIEVEGVPTGFLRIRRAVLEKLADAAEQYQARASESERRKIPLIFERTLEDGVRYGGDYAFCRKWRRMGGAIHIDPKMRFSHYGENAWQGSYSAHLRRNADNILTGLDAIRDGKETPETALELFEEWGNEWAASPGMISAAVMLARETRGDILECGSGLTTLAIAAANPSARVVSLEHDAEWASKVRAYAERFDLRNIDIRVSPIDPATNWYSDKPAGEFSMVVCDGPPRYLGGNRGGVFDAYGEALSGATVIMDDTDDKRQLEIVSNWAGGPVHTFGNKRKFSIAVRAA